MTGTSLFFADPDLAARTAVEQASPPPDPHPPRARTHAESSTRPTRGLASDGKQKLHNPSIRRGVASYLAGAPPRRASAPGLWIFCLP